MSRAAILKTTIISAVVATAIGLGTWAYVGNLPSHKVTAIVDARNKVTELSYKGQEGRDALALLRQHAKVATKHYSFGDQVVSINGTEGSGPKYWTFYINGKMAEVGANSYITKNSDTLTWKLQ